MTSGCPFRLCLIFLLVSVPLCFLTFSHFPKNAFIHVELPRRPRLFDLDPPNVTVVTAFFDIGDFRKGGVDNTRTVKQYLEWMKIWQKIKNGVVFYTHDKKYKSLFEQLRAIHRLPTKNVLVNLGNTSRQEPFWSLSLLPNISRIFQRRWYPKHHPNTVIPMYSTIMNLKFDALEQTILSNPFSTDHFAWIDLGMFRDDSLDVPCFRIVPPPDYDKTKIAMNEVNDASYRRSIKAIIIYNEVWVGGTVMFGHRDAFLQFIKQYRLTAEEMIQRGWYSTDQQTVYAMYADRSLNVPLDIDLQIYRDDGTIRLSHYTGNNWWYLGYLMRMDEAC